MTGNNWRLGLALTLTTCFWWGILPITLAGVMHKVDPATLTFYRFFIAVLLLFPYLAIAGKLSSFRVLSSSRLAIGIFAAGVMLALNYGFYIFALEKMSPSGAQVLIQLAPMLFLLSGIFLFGEQFSGRQWLGFIVFVIGLLLFFYRRLTAMLEGFGDYTVGMALMVAAAIFWALYAILQKRLVQSIGSIHLMLLINAIGAMAFMPMSQPAVAFQLNAAESFLLFLCGLNTVIAYGSFSEALNHWEASRISATLAIVPLLTLSFVHITLAFDWLPLSPEPLDAIVLIGAVMVVLGAFSASLAGQGSEQVARHQ